MKRSRTIVATLCALALVVPGLARGAGQEATGGQEEQEGQESQGPAPAELVVEPAELELEIGDTATLEATVLDAEGNPMDATVLFFSLDRRSVGVTTSGEVEAYTDGEFEILARVPEDPDAGRRSDALVETRVPVTVASPPVTSVEFVDPPGRFWAGTLVRPGLRVIDALDRERQDVDVELESSNPEVVRIGRSGLLELGSAGTAEVTARAEDVTTSMTVDVDPNPTARVELEVDRPHARTGDVFHFDARALDADGDEVEEMPVQYTFRARTEDHDLGSASSGLITPDGRFVADLPGEYLITATAGDRVATEVVTAEERGVRKMFEVVGRGRVADRKTSDLWVWEAPNGRDYAVTGTWGAEGHAYFWDVTDPKNIFMAATVRVDARTVNDVKVSEDGSICIISREGASSRRNGMVILDCSDIENQGVPILARYDDQLTGGVHNVFIDDDHVYALSAGQRYDVINIEDPTQPYRVGRFELDIPGTSIHDVWVSEGIAYSSNWEDGVVVADVGGADMGGSPDNPVKIGQYAYPSGWNHAAFPYRNSDGNFYVFAGDEHFPRDRNPQGIDRFSGPAVAAAGWIHVIEWDEWGEPREVARYQVPEGGTHNFWVADDKLYVAYYNQGVRVVDISGELLGNLYEQGREIAYLLPDDPEGFKANAARTWGVMPFKGLIWAADNNSGLWALKLIDIPERGR